MAPNTSQSKFSLKLMVHKEEMKVIFAEADSSFVDTLFSVMTMPMAAIVKLFRTQTDEEIQPIGSLNNLYQSLLDLSNNYTSTEANKWMLLNPSTSSYDVYTKLKLNINDQEPTRHYICRNVSCRRRSGTCFISIYSPVKCVNCGKIMDLEVKYEDSTAGDDYDGSVFVSDFASYIVTDDLRVMPNSPGSIVQLLYEIGITAVSFLDEKTIEIGLDQIHTILKGAFLFKHPLTYLVFPSSPVIQNLVNPRQETLFKKLTSRTSTRLSLKVTTQKSTSKVLFAEADCDFVEFLFGFLEIPLGTMIGELMNGASSFECLNNLYSSISTMNVGEFIKSDNLKNMLLQPQLVHKTLSENQIFPLSIKSSDSKTYYLACTLGRATQASLTRSQNRCGIGYSYEMHSKTSAKFILSDDLVVTPLTSFSSVTMLGKLNVPFNDFEVVKVSIGIDEGLKILDAALKSMSALTDSILKNNTGN